MSNTAHTPARHDSVVQRTWAETKSALKTTEFYVWLVVSVAILIAAAVTDGGEDGQRFGADHAWLYVGIVTAAYILSRGIAKAGVRKPDHDAGTERGTDGR